MKHLKMLGLLVMAAASLMAFASSASATLTSPAGTEYTGQIHATLLTPETALLKAGIEDTCGESTLLGDVTTNDPTIASGPITVLSFGDCTRTTKVLKPGSLKIEGGSVTAIGNEVTVEELGVSCVYGGGAGTKVGKLEGDEPAFVNVSTTELPKISGGFLCASKGTWTAKYTVTTPKTLTWS